MNKVTTYAAATQINHYPTGAVTDAEQHLLTISTAKLGSDAWADLSETTSESPSYAEVGDVIVNLRPT